MELEDAIFREISAGDKLKEAQMLMEKRDGQYLRLKKKIIVSSNLINLYKIRESECEKLSEEIRLLQGARTQLESEHEKLLLEHLNLTSTHDKMAAEYEKLKPLYETVLIQFEGRGATINQLQDAYAELKSIEGLTVEKDLVISTHKKENSKLKEIIQNIKISHTKEIKKLESKISELYNYALCFGKKAYPTLTMKNKILLQNLQVQAKKFQGSDDKIKVIHLENNLCDDILEEELDEQGPLSCASSVDTGKGSSIYASDDEKYPSIATTPLRECLSPKEFSFSVVSPPATLKPVSPPLNIESETNIPNAVENIQNTKMRSIALSPIREVSINSSVSVATSPISSFINISSKQPKKCIELIKLSTLPTISEDQTDEHQVEPMEIPFENENCSPISIRTIQDDSRSPQSDNTPMINNLNTISPGEKTCSTAKKITSNSLKSKPIQEIPTFTSDSFIQSKTHLNVNEVDQLPKLNNSDLFSPVKDNSSNILEIDLKVEEILRKMTAKSVLISPLPWNEIQDKEKLPSSVKSKNQLKKSKLITHYKNCNRMMRKKFTIYQKKWTRIMNCMMNRKLSNFKKSFDFSNANKPSNKNMECNNGLNSTYTPQLSLINDETEMNTNIQWELIQKCLKSLIAENSINLDDLSDKKFNLSSDSQFTSKAYSNMITHTTKIIQPAQMEPISEIPTCDTSSTNNIDSVCQLNMSNCDTINTSFVPPCDLTSPKISIIEHTEVGLNSLDSENSNIFKKLKTSVSSCNKSSPIININDQTEINLNISNCENTNILNLSVSPSNQMSPIITTIEQQSEVELNLSEFESTNISHKKGKSLVSCGIPHSPSINTIQQSEVELNLSDCENTNILHKKRKSSVHCDIRNSPSINTIQQSEIELNLSDCESVNILHKKGKSSVSCDIRDSPSINTIQQSEIELNLSDCESANILHEKKKSSVSCDIPNSPSINTIQQSEVEWNLSDCENTNILHKKRKSSVSCDIRDSPSMNTIQQTEVKLTGSNFENTKILRICLKSVSPEKTNQNCPLINKIEETAKKYVENHSYSSFKDGMDDRSETFVENIRSPARSTRSHKSSINSQYFVTPPKRNKSDIEVEIKTFNCKKNKSPVKPSVILDSPAMRTRSQKNSKDSTSSNIRSPIQETSFECEKKLNSFSDLFDPLVKPKRSQRTPKQKYLENNTEAAKRTTKESINLNKLPIICTRNHKSSITKHSNENTDKRDFVVETSDFHSPTRFKTSSYFPTNNGDLNVKKPNNGDDSELTKEKDPIKLSTLRSHSFSMTSNSSLINKQIISRKLSLCEFNEQQYTNSLKQASDSKSFPSERDPKYTNKKIKEKNYSQIETSDSKISNLANCLKSNSDDNLNNMYIPLEKIDYCHKTVDNLKNTPIKKSRKTASRNVHKEELIDKSVDIKHNHCNAKVNLVKKSCQLKVLPINGKQFSPGTSNRISETENMKNLEKAKLVMAEMNLTKTPIKRPIIRKKIIRKIQEPYNDIESEISLDSETNDAENRSKSDLDNVKIFKVNQQSPRDIINYNSSFEFNVEESSDCSIFKRLLEKNRFSMKRNTFHYKNPQDLCDKLENYLSKEFSNDSLPHFVSSITMEKEKSLAYAIVEFLCNGNRFNETLDREYPMLPMTKSHRKLLCLINHFNASPPVHYKKNLMELVLSGIEYKIFTLNNTPEVGALKTMAPFYAVLCRLLKQKDRLKLFCMDAIYCLSYKSIPLIYCILQSWPNLIPHSKFLTGQDPLTVTFLHYVLSNFSEQADYNASKMKLLLNHKYGYRAGLYTDDEILQNLTEKIKDCKFDKSKSLMASFLLLGKRCGVDKCYNKIILNTLLPMLENSNIPTFAKATAAKLIGPLVRPFPSTMVLQCEILLQKMIKILKLTDYPQLQEAIILSILYFSKRNMKEVVHAVNGWKPSFTVSAEAVEALESFIKQHNYYFWQKLS